MPHPHPLPPLIPPPKKASVTSDADVLTAVNVEVFPDGEDVNHLALFGNSLVYDDAGIISGAGALIQVVFPNLNYLKVAEIVFTVCSTVCIPVLAVLRRVNMLIDLILVFPHDKYCPVVHKQFKAAGDCVHSADQQCFTFPTIWVTFGCGD